MNLPDSAQHDSWGVAAGTFVSYAVILVSMTLLLFVIPYLIFLFL